MAVVVTLEVITVDAHDVVADVKVGDVFEAILEFNHGVHYYVIKTKEGKRHHLLRDQVIGIDKTKI